MGIKLGLVGLGSFGSCFAPLFASHPLVDGVVLCDAEESKLERWANDPVVSAKLIKGGCYTSLDDLCKERKCDAVVIITQPWLHAPQCIQVMEAGMDVYSAVPVISLPDDEEILDWCGRIIDASVRTGKHYMLGETTIYRPQTQFCRRKALAGEFGNFVFAEAEYAHDVDSASCSLRKVQASRTTGKVGSEHAAFIKKYIDRGCKSHPMSYPTHSVSGPIYVMDTKAIKVSAYGTKPQFENDPFFTNSDFSNIVAFYQLANGCSLRVAELREISSNTGLMGEDFRIFGTRGSYSYNDWRDNGRVELSFEPRANKSTKLTDKEMFDSLPEEVATAFLHALNKDAKPGDDFVPSGHGGSHPYLVHEFVSSVAEGRRPVIDAWKAASYMAMGVAAHKSACKDGEIVPVFDFGEPR